jgi:RNA polymerase sigma-70 factor (sigma-E family)
MALAVREHDVTVTGELSGDAAAPDFESWAAARGPALVRFAHLVTGGSPDAPDLAQDALAQVWARWGRLDGDAEAYARRCVTNGSVSRWRKLGRLRSVAQVAETAGPDPTAAVDDADQAWALLVTLTPVQRAAVVLRFYEERSYAEIGSLLDVPEATARSHVHRALRSLRTRLEEQP